MSLFRMGADEALVDIASFNLHIVNGVIRTYVENAIAISRHNLEVARQLAGKKLGELTDQELENLCKISLFVPPLEMPSFVTMARGSAITYWRKNVQGSVELAIGTSVTGGGSFSMGTETARQQSDTWGCEITWNTGDTKVFLQAFRDLAETLPDFEDNWDKVFGAPEKEPDDGENEEETERPAPPLEPPAEPPVPAEDPSADPTPGA